MQMVKRVGTWWVVLLLNSFHGMGDVEEVHCSRPNSWAVPQNLD